MDSVVSALVSINYRRYSNVDRCNLQRNRRQLNKNSVYSTIGETLRSGYSVNSEG